MALQDRLREPTGLPSWPIICVAAGEKLGKTWQAIAATASDLVGFGYVVSVGEDDPDEYAQIPGARFQIVGHDGTHRDMLTALREASEAPPVIDGKPNVLILDGAGRWWELLSDQANDAAHVRAKKAAAKYNKPYDPDDEVTIHPDLWNAAKDKWYDVLDVLRAHKGPVIVTALLENQVVMDAAGKPTKDRHWKIKAQKNLPADVGAVVESPAYGEWYLTGVRSARIQPTQTGVYNRDNQFMNFSIDALWRTLGLADTANVGERSHNVLDATMEVDTFMRDMNHVTGNLHAKERLDALRDLYRKYGEDAMRAMQVTAPDGSPCTGLDMMIGLVNETKAILANAGNGAPGQQQTAPNAPAQSAHAAPTQSAPQQQSAPVEHPAKRAADAQQAADSAAIDAPKNGHMGALLTEVTGHADVFNISVEDYTAALRAAHGVENVGQLKVPVLRGWLLEQRPDVIKALREQGRSTEADSLEQAGQKVALWPVLVGTANAPQAAREEPAA